MKTATLLLLTALFMPLAAQPSVLPDHPRLLVSSADWKKLPSRMKADPVIKEIITTCIARADEVMGAETLTRKLDGRRLLAVSRAAIQRVLDLSSAWKVTRDERYLRRCRDELIAVCGFKDWNPSHHLDTGEMQTAVAIGYDWLYHDLSPEDRRIIGTALLEKGLRTSFSDKRPRKVDNNWNQVCNGGLILSALALHEIEPQLAEEAIREAMSFIPLALNVGYAPDGAYSEGGGYWEYGTSYTAITIEALRKSGHGEPSFAKHPGLLKSADYITQMFGPSGTVFSYGDSRESSIQATSTLAWMARESRSAPLRSLILPTFRKIKPGRSDRFLALSAFWFPSGTAANSAPLPLHFHGTGNSPITIHRSGFGKNDTFLGIKAGKAAVNHGHMDAGSFVLDSLGQRWASDLGMQSYLSLESRGIRLFDKEQASARWTVFRLNNLSHNTLTYNGKVHQAEGYAKIVSSAGAPDHRTDVDLTAALGLPAGAMARRVFRIHPGTFHITITDTLTGLNPGDTIDWNMMTRARTQARRGGFDLAMAGKKLGLDLSSSAAGSKVSAAPADPPPADHDTDNPGVTGIKLRATADSSGGLEITARFRSAE